MSRAAVLAMAGVLMMTAIPFAAQGDPHGRGHGYGGGPPPGRFEAGPGRHAMGPPPGWRGGQPGMRGEPGRGERPPFERWDDQRFNGYWLGSRWYYGPPPGDIEVAPTFRPGYAPWRRGAFLPPHYQDQVVEDYWRFHLRRPPYGYHWIQVGGDFLLVSDSTGLIFDIIPAE